MKNHTFRTLAILAALICSTSIQAKGDTNDNPGLFSGLAYSLRVGQSIGGAMPATMPAEIRSLDRFGLCLNPQLGIAVSKPLEGRWGVVSGLYLEAKGMDIDATVKNYHIKMVQGGEKMEGQFTGCNHTKENQLALTVPLQAAYNINRFSLHAGFYTSLVIDTDFEGYAYDGYLRRRDDGMMKGDPTGEKILLGTSPSERGDYDFADDMRRWQWGAIAGIDCQVSRLWEVYASVSYGFAAIHKSSFTTLDNPLHPIYGTIGVAYRLEKK